VSSYVWESSVLFGLLGCASMKTPREAVAATPVLSPEARRTAPSIAGGVRRSPQRSG
jgi:hypothetical protein